MSHTKGPWRIRQENPVSFPDIETADDYQLSICKIISSFDQMNNAHLIAAAPDMLEALELLINDNRLMNAMTKEQSKAIMYSIKKAKGYLG